MKFKLPPPDKKTLLKIPIVPQAAPQGDSQTLLRMQSQVPPTEDPLEKEMRLLYNKPLRYTNNLPASQVIKSAAQKAGINPALLFSSAFQEGFNKSIAKPDEVSEAYTMAKMDGNFPVDGFYNYGLDTFGDRYEQLKKYLPEGFDKRFKLFDVVSEIEEKKQKAGQPYKTYKSAAFMNDEDALIAKAAFIRAEGDALNEYAKSKGVTLDEEAQNYFTLAAYNSGAGNAKKMLDKYVTAKDKKKWLQDGDGEWQKVHKNVSPRIKKMKLAAELLNQ